jgi:hypothetical protein
MNKLSKLELKAQEDWIIDVTRPNNERKLAITITFKQGRPRKDGTWERLSYDEVKKLVKAFYKSTNKMAFKNAYQRHGKRVFLLTAIEDHYGEKRLHAHLSLGIPPQFTVDAFSTWVQSELKAYSWVYEQVHVEYLETRAEQQHWHRYLCKENLELELFEPEPYKHD